jgi:hypothetical protein
MIRKLNIYMKHKIVSFREIIYRFTIAVYCLKHSIPADFNLVPVNEVEKLMKSGGLGRVEI